MLDDVMTAVAPVSVRLMAGWEGVPGPDILLRAAAAGYLAGRGTPPDEAVALVEEWAVQGLVQPAPPNPFLAGLPWSVPGPVAGAPYYKRG